MDLNDEEETSPNLPTSEPAARVSPRTHRHAAALPAQGPSRSAPSAPNIPSRLRRGHKFSSPRLTLRNLRLCTQVLRHSTVPPRSDPPPQGACGVHHAQFYWKDAGKRPYSASRGQPGGMGSPCRVSWNGKGSGLLLRREAESGPEGGNVVLLSRFNGARIDSPTPPKHAVVWCGRGSARFAS